MSKKVDWVFACCKSVNKVYQVDATLFDGLEDKEWDGPFWLRTDKELKILSISPDKPTEYPPLPKSKKGKSE